MNINLHKYNTIHCISLPLKYQDQAAAFSHLDFCCSYVLKTEWNRSKTKDTIPNHGWSQYYNICCFL